MNDIAYGALKRIIEEVKEYRKLPTNTIGGNDIQLVEAWISETEKEHGAEPEIPEWAETVRELLEDVANDEVHVYAEPTEPNETVYDDGFVHVRRDGVRFSTWFGETASIAKISKFERTWEKVVDDTVTRV